MSKLIKDPLLEIEIVNLLDLATRLMLSEDADLDKIKITAETHQKKREKVLPTREMLGRPQRGKDPVKEYLAGLVRARWQREAMAAKS